MSEEEIIKVIENGYKKLKEKPILIQELEEQNKVIQKQNKIIDLMSKELTNIIDATEEEIKECFRKKVE